MITNFDLPSRINHFLTFKSFLHIPCYRAWLSLMFERYRPTKNNSSLAAIETLSYD